jgi:TolB-like protein
MVCLVRLGFGDSLGEVPPSLVFGDYEVSRREDGSVWELGRGAMGVTYRAEDTVLNRRVALKVVNPPTTGGNGQAVRDRFLREARAAAAFRHPNVAGVFQFGALPGGNRCYYAMELVEGETLEALVRRDGPLKVEVALEMAVQVTRALIAAAAHGLVHRDLKAGNIMLTRGDVAKEELEVKVIDFGLAKAIADRDSEMDLTKGGFVGTPAFASPEQFSGALADARSDIYSLGATLWYALTGDVPYAGTSIEEIRRCQRELALPTERLAARKIPRSVIRLLRRILSLDPIERPASARELMEALELCRARLGYTRPNEWKAWPAPRKFIALAGLLAIGAAAFFAFRPSGPKPAAPTLASAKSIAVLPFQNMSDDKQNGYFADGVQEEILTTLAKVADLKVISRTSVMQFRDAEKRSVREIAQQLGVAHVLEGSVQRSVNRVRVTAQLIDARTDSHVWGQRYDGDLADVFAIQTEIAQNIAGQLKAVLSPNEQTALQAKPTLDPAAYDLYLRAREILSNEGYEHFDSIRKQIPLLDQAIARDPTFVPALCMLMQVHLAAYWFNFDHTPARLELARKAIEAAARLQPDGGEVHRALGLFKYYLESRDYASALSELALARRSLPNDAEVLQFIGGIQVRRAHFKEADVAFEQALILDPRNAQLVGEGEVSSFYLGQKRYDDARRVLDNLLAWKPDDIVNRLWRARIDLHEKGDLGSLQKVLSELPPTADHNLIANTRRWLALLQRDYRAADAVPSENQPPDLLDNGFITPRELRDGIIARGLGDTHRAEAAFLRGRERAAVEVAARPEDAKALIVLASIDAKLGRKEEAVREAERAVEILPVAVDAYDGALVLARLAGVYAEVKETDRSLDVLRRAVVLFHGPSYGDLQLGEEWDTLRNDARFQKILASLAPNSGDTNK